MGVKTLMFQGTGSHVGKSILTAAMCRILKQDGYLVAPFKSQNMALNSFITQDGSEMGRAQAVQAQAAGIIPHIDMNPILLKPIEDMKSQVIVLGKTLSDMDAKSYHKDYAIKAMNVIEGAFNRLSKGYDVIVIEGAGSPAEVNLKATEVVNMRIARRFNAPVLLIADIDKGGALAQVVGTLELLEPDERELVKGIVINKFRGDIELLKPALNFLEDRTGKPVVGVVPYFKGFRVPEEDSIPESKTIQSLNKNPKERIEIAVIRLPHILNFTDFDPLEAEQDVLLHYVDYPEQLDTADCIIVPGTKNTIEDISYITRSGIAEKTLENAKNGTPVVGIGGGYQMLGKRIRDRRCIESQHKHMEGLGLLDIETIFGPEEPPCQVRAMIEATGLFFEGMKGGEVEGYKIHTGISEYGTYVNPLFRLIDSRDGTVNAMDGAESEDGNVFGTYLHGIFDNDMFRRKFINTLRLRRGWKNIAADSMTFKAVQERDLDILAGVVREAVNMKKIYGIMGLQ